MTAEEVAKHLGVKLPEPNIDNIIKEWKNNPDPELDEYIRTLRQYKKQFGEDDLNNAVSEWPDEQWIKIMKLCMRLNRKYTDLFGHHYAIHP